MILISDEVVTTVVVFELHLKLVDVATAVFPVLWSVLVRKELHHIWQGWYEKTIFEDFAGIQSTILVDLLESKIDDQGG